MLQQAVLQVKINKEMKISIHSHTACDSLKITFNVKARAALKFSI